MSGHTMEPKDLDRIVACVNACKGLADPSVVPELLNTLEMIRDADNDCQKDGLPTMPAPARQRIDSVIAKAKGER